MQRDFEALLWDVNDAGRSVLRFTAGSNLDDYLSNDLVRSAVERKFEIVGEALARMRQFFPEQSQSITGLSSIVAFRNRLIHEYDRIEHEKRSGR